MVQEEDKMSLPCLFFEEYVPYDLQA
jgi:hypothetical protein